MSIRIAARRALLALLPVVAATAAAATPFAPGAATVQVDGSAVRPPAATWRSHAQPPETPLTGTPVTVPLWTSLFSWNGQAWGSVMVGTDPAQGSATTTVPVTIVPLRMVFARDGMVQEYPGMAQELAGSALFQPLPFATGTTQYGDAFRRGDFWPAVASVAPDYHVLLGAPAIAPVQVLTVPAALGLTYVVPAANRRYAIADGSWFYERVRQMVASLHIDPRSLVVFLAYNTDITWQGTPDSCFTTGCSLYGGVHGAIVNGAQLASPQAPQSVNTYAYASFMDWGDVIPMPLRAEVNEHLMPASHELLEWLDDPLVMNLDPSQPYLWQRVASIVPPAISPYADGCTRVYEVADPLDRVFALGFPHGDRLDLFSAAVFQSWFARQSPSTAVLGLYDTAGLLGTYSTPCP